MYDLLFSPTRINKLRLKNRFLMLPMHMCFTKDHEVSERDIAFYRKRAAGGAGAITVSAAILPGGALYRMHFIESDDRIAGLSRLADALHQYDCKLFIQLFHCGRCGNTETLSGLHPIAPSAIPSRIYKETPQVMTIEDIIAIEDAFADAAVRAKKAGADGVELSASVGYIITEFISEVTNHRTDEYGGSEENRFRFPIEVFRKVRAAVGPDYPVMMRLSAAQMEPGGYGIDTAIRFCQALEEENLLDMVSVTGGWHESPLPLINYYVPPAGYAYMADTLHRKIESPVLVSTRLNDGEMAEKMLEDGIADLIGMARPFLTDPMLPNKIKQGLPFNKCLGCSRGCNEKIYIPEDATCVLNPEVGQEYREEAYILSRENKRKKMLVVGAGPAGLYAAVKAAQRGYRVTLVTDENRLGGTMYQASLPPHKKDIMGFVENKAYEMEQLGVKVLLDTEVDEDFIKKMKPDYVAIATGGMPLYPNIPGLKANEDKIYLPSEVLEPTAALLTKLKRGKTIVLGGGLVGLETAIFLAEKSFGGDMARDFYFQTVATSGLAPVMEFQNITIVEMKKKIGSDLGSLRRFAIPEAKRMQIRMLTETKVVAIKEKVVIVENAEGEKALPYDHIILAAGMRSYVPDFVSTLDEMHIPYVRLGDANEPGDFMHATRSAFEWSLTI